MQPGSLESLDEDAMFSWPDACVYVISMAHSHDQRAAVQRQLLAHGIQKARVWPGVVLGDNALSVLHELAARCMPVIVLQLQL